MRKNDCSEKSDSSLSSRTEEDHESIFRLSFDLVTSARRNICFLKRVSECQWFHHHPSLLLAINRYDELWMPLVSDLYLGSMTPMVLPPLDVQWVWFCHTLNPASYRLYCESRFSKLIEKPAIFDDENEEYALNRCRDIWVSKYPSEPFDLEPNSDEILESTSNKTLMNEVLKHKSLYSKFSKPYMSEIVYLISARKRYQRFLYLLQKFRDGYSKLVPTLDIQLIWLTHKSYPVVYAGEVKEIEGDFGKVVGIWESSIDDEDIKVTKKLWERGFDECYEKAGATLDEIIVKSLSSSSSIKSPIYWEVWDYDVNTKYKSLEPRFLLEVCISVRAERNVKETRESYLRLRTSRCHRELKIDKPNNSVPSDTWQRMSHLYCEFGTRGVLLELRHRRGGGSRRFCCKNSSSRSTIVFPWNDLLRAQSLTLEREMETQLRVVVSITPPTQAPYLLKCVPDRVTDDSGAMISDIILKMNHYRPQDGRWLSRTVLDHAGRECFIVRIRVGSGIWRRGGEKPVGVKMEDRIIEVREGSWTYVAGGSIGKAPDKVVGTATPKLEEGLGDNKALWSLSNGDELTIQRNSSSSGFTFNLHTNQTSHDSVRLLKGRQMQYQLVVASKKKEDEKKEDEDEDFVTLVRYTEENPSGKATALINWKLLLIEVTPEEDAVMVLLVSMAILRSVTEMKKEDVGGLLIRRRSRETKLGLRDWGSVLLHPSLLSSNSGTGANNSPLSSVHLQPWYWNPKVVMAPPVEVDHHKTLRQPMVSHYSSADGDDNLYKRTIIP